MPVIIVGVDGSAASHEAVRWALAEARLRGAVLRLVHVWQPEHPWGAAVGAVAAPWNPSDLDRQRRSAEAILDQAVEETSEQGGAPVRVERLAAEGAPAAVLVEEARNADLLVVGSRGHSGLAGLLLGSVSSECAHHARCPVVIFRI